MGLSFEAHPVACPVVKDPEAVRRIDFPQLHLDAVVGISVSGEDVQAPAPGRSQFLGDDPDLTEAQPSRAVGEPVLQPDLVVAEIA
jgi:hypothetical protein